jgi:8-oxo-dGTP diphosphatase
MLIRATLGFVFDTSLEQVLLIHKNRPEWQKGDINGLGGKCEGQETFAHCIAREVREEAGIWIAPQNWRRYAQLNWDIWKVAVFASIYRGEMADAQSQTDEEISWHPVVSLPPKVKTNLPWLIPMAIDALKRNEIKLIKAVYN